MITDYYLLLEQNIETFEDQLELAVYNNLFPLIGQGSDANFYIRTWPGQVLPDLPPEELPLVTINILSKEKSGQAEQIGMHHGMYDYAVRVLYFDIASQDTPGSYANFFDGKSRRSSVISRIEGSFQTNSAFNLQGCAFSNTIAGYRENVYDTQIPTFNFDVSGQEGYYSFVGEIYLVVNTERTSLN